MAQKFLSCRVLTPTGMVYQDNATMIIAPSVEGEVGILPTHEPYICSLKPGPLRIKNGEDEQLFAISHGYLEVDMDRVAILVDVVESANAIDIQRAEMAKQRAEQRLAELDKNNKKEYKIIQADLERALNRINVGNKHRQ